MPLSRAHESADPQAAIEQGKVFPLAVIDDKVRHITEHGRAFRWLDVNKQIGRFPAITSKAGKRRSARHARGSGAAEKRGQLYCR